MALTDTAIKAAKPSSKPRKLADEKAVAEEKAKAEAARLKAEADAKKAEEAASARKLAEGLADMPGLHVDLDTVQTNLVFVDIEGPRTAPEIAIALADDGIRVNIFSESRIRFATHYCVDMDDIYRVLGSVHHALHA